MGLIRTINNLFAGWLKSEDNWHGRSGKQIWLDCFFLIYIEILQKLNEVSTTFVDSLKSKWILNILEPVVSFGLLISKIRRLEKIEISFGFKNIAALTRLYDTASSNDLSTDIDKNQVFSIFSISRVDLGRDLFQLVLQDCALLKIPNLLLWCIKFVENQNDERIKIGWIEFLQNFESDDETLLLHKMKLGEIQRDSKELKRKNSL